MLTEIRLKNFKCFREETVFPLAKINLLTGINGRGKSTLLQSLLLMKQSVEYNPHTDEIILNGNCVNLGTGEDIKNKFSTDSEQTFSYCDSNFCLNYIFSNQKLNYINLHIFRNRGVYNENQIIVAKLKKDDKNKILVSYHVNSKDIFIEKKFPFYGFENLFFSEFLIDNLRKSDESDSLKSVNSIVMSDLPNMWKKIHYIAADRLGSQEYYKKMPLPKFVSLDRKGENLASILSYFKNENKDVLSNTSELLSKILDSPVIVKIQDNIPHIIPLTFEIFGKEYNPNNVGFGYSYALPIIVSGLIAKKGEILIIENPEAHLHPKAQSELTKFLAKVASKGVQVFIESHSEHILNGLRVAVLQKDIEISHQDLNILYFKNDLQEPFVKLNVEKNGKIKHWVDGFFDQQEQDLAEIFKLGKEQK
ncbi:MAG: DUF3696 domain-containing protein [Bacteroidetes bacterium]|nr:MAG: DUF3696 domain-containing protein [Bacteroidota bacterium]